MTRIVHNVKSHKRPIAKSTFVRHTPSISKCIYARGLGLADATACSKLYRENGEQEET